MAEKRWEERKIRYLIISLLFAIAFFWILPHIHTVPCETHCIEPDSLIFLEIFIFFCVFIFVIVYFSDIEIYKIIGKQYRYAGIKKEEKEEIEQKEIWTKTD